jgi:chemotaxis response regulator CheB
MKKHVCLLFSDQMLTEVMRDFLVKNGFEVSNSAFGNLNMAIYLAGRPDVIVLGGEDVEKFQSFLDQLDPEDRQCIHDIPIIIFSSTSKELYATSVARGFDQNPCTSQYIAETEEET